MTFHNYVLPLFDSFPRMDEVYFNYIARGPDDRFELKDVALAVSKGLSRRHMRRIRDRLNKLVLIYEMLVNEGVIT